MELNSKLNTVLLGLIVILLAIGVYYIAKDKNSSTYVNNSNAPAEIVDVSKDAQKEADQVVVENKNVYSHCNLKLNILANQNISFPFSLTGKITIPSTTGCAWTVFEGQVGSVDVLSNGISLGSYPLKIEQNFNYQNGVWNISSDINLEADMISGDHLTLRVNKDDPSGENPDAFEIPIVLN